MKLTIEPSLKPEGSASCNPPKVVVEHPYDGLSIDDVTPLIMGALVAYGFHPKTVNEYIVTESFNWGDRDEC